MSESNGHTNQAIPGVTRTLRDGKEYTFVLDFSAMLLVEEETGENALEAGAWNNLTGRKLIVFLWACAMHQFEHLPKVERPTVGAFAKLFRVGDVSMMLQLVNDVWDNGMPKGDDSDSEAENERPLVQVKKK